MAPLRAKIGVKRTRKKENNYCRSVLFLLNAKQKIPKKKMKKNSKKLKNNIMAPFRAKIG